MIVKISIPILVILHLSNGYLEWDIKSPAISQNLHEEVLDPVLCEEHLKYLNEDLMLRLQFLESGLRLPRGILEGNTNDLGNYHQCLSINRQLENSEIQGKYCLVLVPLTQDLTLPNLGLPGFDESSLKDVKSKLEGSKELMLKEKGLAGTFEDSRLTPDSPFSSIELRLAVCLPKPCTTKQAITSIFFNVSEFGFEYREELCRLPDDKQWVAVDYLAVVLFSLIGFVTLVCTIIEVTNKFVYKHEAHSTCYTFSVYTNGRRLMNFSSGPDALYCIDGIRALAMLWVLIGHTFSTIHFWANPLVGYEWQKSPRALWLVSGTITVDTFFVLSGILIVYTTSGKLSGNFYKAQYAPNWSRLHSCRTIMLSILICTATRKHKAADKNYTPKLLQNVHIFYLNRVLRMFPVLATGVLLEASLLNRLSDGPYWVEVANLVERCRTFWWSTLLYVQNYMSPTQMCIGVTWYLAIDMQLYILSPLVLFWVLNGSKMIAWSALILAFILQLSAATTYNFMKNFPSSSMNVQRADELIPYFQQYYMNTLTRASPFLVGMIVGYILFCTKCKRVRLTWPMVVLGWVCTAALLSFVIYCVHPIQQHDWDNQVIDNLYNSFIRTIWAVGLGWMIFACVHGYGGPINWLLSLHIFKLPARLSYAMYIFHYGLMVVVNSSATAPTVWSVKGVMFKFLGHYSLVFMVSFVVTLVIDAPCSVLFKKLLSGVSKGKTKPAVNPENTKEV